MDYLTLYDFIEFIVQDEETPFKCVEITNALNAILERELSAYRIINGNLTPIVNAEQMEAIEDAIASTSNEKYSGANIHLKAALQKISNKENPDYRNSIKESISAVESVCQVLVTDTKVELGKALKKLKEKIDIHPSLEQGFIKIYGYTSDGDGIRHAMQQERFIYQEDAIFMFVACSAFINYLIIKADKPAKTLQ